MLIRRLREEGFSGYGQNVFMRRKELDLLHQSHHSYDERMEHKTCMWFFTMAVDAGPEISKKSALYVTFQKGLDFYCQGFLFIELQIFACRCRKSDDDPHAAKT